jgi:hypothetical protein
MEDGARGLVHAVSHPAAALRGHHVPAADTYGMRGRWSASSVAEVVIEALLFSYRPTPCQSCL